MSFSSRSGYPVGQFLPAGYGTDKLIPTDDPTLGFKLNHFMLRIRDPEESLHFYVDLMGMRTVFTMNTGPFTIYYLGYPQTDEHRADPVKFGVDTVSKLQHTLGLLELYHVHGSENQPSDYYSTGNEPPNLGFGHLGFTVPDVPTALKRLQGAGVKVLKPLGVTTRETIPLSKWEAEKGIGRGAIHAEYAKVFDNIAFVMDPNGYTVELVPQKMDPNNPGGSCVEE